MVIGGGFVTFWGKINLKTVLAVGCIYLCAIALIIYSLVDSYLLAKDEFLFPSFSFLSAQRTLLIVLVSLFIIMSVLAVLLIFKKTCKTDKIAIPRVVNWIAFVVSSVGVVLAGVFLAMAMSFACVSHTTDLNHYLSFDSVDIQNNVVEYFPSKETVDMYIAEGAEISYEYFYNSGIFDRASTYSVELDVKQIEPQKYQNLKSELTQMYQENDTDSNGKMRLVVMENFQKDIDGYEFSTICCIEFDDTTHCIVYSTVQEYS